MSGSFFFLLIIVSRLLEYLNIYNYCFCCNSREYLDAQKSFLRSRPTSDDEENTKFSVVTSSASLSALLIPSVKEVGSDYILHSHQSVTFSSCLVVA